jgi:hypothetical protein
MQLELFMELKEQVKKPVGRTQCCDKCGEEKDLSQFYLRQYNTSGVDSTCKRCMIDDQTFRIKLRKEIGHLEPDVCDCCGKPPNGKSRATKLCIDHDHKTGKLRGWLCMDCNRGIGLLGDDLTGVLNALEYLKKVKEE